jgi:hypothetical protein
VIFWSHNNRHDQNLRNKTLILIDLLVQEHSAELPPVHLDSVETNRHYKNDFRQRVNLDGQKRGMNDHELIGMQRHVLLH